MPTVLVVDDSPLDRQLIGELLAEDAGLRVQYAVNGAAALLAMAQGLPDVVATDLLMPELDGLGLVAAVRKLYPLVPVILMTGYGDLMKANGEMPPHISVILSKPFTRVTLRGALVEALANGNGKSEKP